MCMHSQAKGRVFSHVHATVEPNYIKKQLNGEFTQGMKKDLPIL